MCKACAIPYDQKEADRFAEDMVGHMNSASLMIMCSIGHRTGLFDTMAELPPSTSDQIATAAKLNERYVREWLGAMTTGRIVQYTPEDDTYVLPPEHAAWLTRKSSPNNIAVTAQWVPEMAYVEDRIVECFRDGGGITYEQMNRFHEIMADESRQTVVQPLKDNLLPLMPGMAERLKAGIEVADIGCGSGEALIALARRFPASRFTGVDLTPEAVRRARESAAGLSNIRFLVQDATEWQEPRTYDLIFTFDAVHDQARPETVLANIHASLKPGGTYFMQDIAGSSHVEKNLAHPLGTFIYTISCTGCMPISLGQGGRGLGAMWGRELATRMLGEAGFNAVEVKQLEHDFINTYYVSQK